MEWYHKYSEKLDFFKQAEEKGIKIQALETEPHFTEQELFFWRAYNILHGASYCDISKFCEDHLMTVDERHDLIRMLNALNAHYQKITKPKK